MSDEPVRRSVAERIVDRVAEAMYLSAVQGARDHVASRSLPTEKIQTVFEDSFKASDREAAIVIFALVDDIATEFFREKLTGTVSGGIDQTFLSGNGILASAYNKILLLAGLEWIRGEVYNQLRFMRRVRNEFAHHVEYKSFNQSPIRDYIDAMSETEGPAFQALRDHVLSVEYATEPSSKKEVAEAILNERITSRAKFLARSALAVGSMVQDLAIIQAAIRHRVDPRSIAGHGFDEQPENVKALLRTVARLASIILGDALDR
jgi:hypothetical protein